MAWLRAPGRGACPPLQPSPGYQACLACPESASSNTPFALGGSSPSCLAVASLSGVPMLSLSLTTPLPPCTCRPPSPSGVPSPYSPSNAPCFAWVQSTILSRFDLIFIIKDERNADRDKMIARHVLDVHRLAGAQPEADEEDRKVRYACCRAALCFASVLGLGMQRVGGRSGRLAACAAAWSLSGWWAIRECGCVRARTCVRACVRA
jgi:hypothetical protein